MITQDCDVLVLTEKERFNRFKDPVIRRRFDQADLVLCLEDTFGYRLVVLKDRFGLIKGDKK